MDKKIAHNSMILGENQYYSLDCYKTQLNNNVLVVGTSGAGKSRSIVTPNLLQAVGSYIVSDPKGNLYKKYGDYLRGKGYDVKKLDFTDPEHSSRYNFFSYIRSNKDIVKIAHMLVNQQRGGSFNGDPFWDDATQLLVQALVAYLYYHAKASDRNFGTLMQLLEYCNVQGDMSLSDTGLDCIMSDIERNFPDSYAVSTYKKFRVAADRTLRSILITLSSKLGLFDTPEIRSMMSGDDLDIAGIGQRKTALFVIVSDTDRSMDNLANMFFMQAINELCLYADKSCKDERLPVPVRLILDDFATNCRIDEFPRMIASIRSRGISTMLMIQAESQLEEGYGNDGKTIIGNCDTYVYLGGNDIATAKAVAERCDVPVKRILNMPVGTNWIFRRGQEPVNGRNFDLEKMAAYRKLRLDEKVR